MRSCARNTFACLSPAPNDCQAVAVISEPHRFSPLDLVQQQVGHPHAERLVDDLRLRQALERQADLHRAAGHGEPQGLFGQLDAALGGHALERAGDRHLQPPVDLREPPAQLRVADHVRPELEEDRQPAVVAIDAAGRVRRDAVEPGGGVARRTAPRSAPPRPLPAARRRRRTGPPWRRSSSRPRPSCSPPPPRSGRARWRGSRRSTNARSAAAIRSSRVCSRRSARVRRAVAIPSVF